MSESLYRPSPLSEEPYISRLRLTSYLDNTTSNPAHCIKCEETTEVVNRETDNVQSIDLSDLAHGIITLTVSYQLDQTDRTKVIIERRVKSLYPKERMMTGTVPPEMNCVCELDDLYGKSET